MSFFSLYPKIDYDLENNNVLYTIKDIFKSANIPEVFLDDYLFFRKYEIPDGNTPEIVSNELYGTPDYHWTFCLINENLKEGTHKWPLSTQQLQSYIAEYLGDTVINCIPKTIIDVDGIVLRTENNLIGRFNIGETVTGFLSGATGKVKSFNIDLQQMLIEEVNGVFQDNELLTGQISKDQVSIYKATSVAEAPVEYRDSNGNVQNNLLFYPEGISNADLTPFTYIDYLEDINNKRRLINVIQPQYIKEFVDKYKTTIRS